MKNCPKSKLSIELRTSLLDDDGWSTGAPSEGGERRMGGGAGGGEMSREELLQLYVMKLDEEANYFKATSPVEEEFCNCPKCQVRCALDSRNLVNILCTWLDESRGLTTALGERKQLSDNTRPSRRSNLFHAVHSEWVMTSATRPLARPISSRPFRSYYWGSFHIRHLKRDFRDSV